MARLGVIAGAIGIALGLAAPASAVADLTKLTAAVTQIGALNTIVFGNLTSNQHIEGKAWVGGNVTGNLVVGQGNSSQGAKTSTYSTLTVGGGISGTVNVNNGTNGTSGKVATAGGVSGGLGSNYGVTVVGNTGTVNFNDQTIAAGISVGGNLTGAASVGANSVVSIGGYADSISTGSGATINVGQYVNSLTAGTNTTARIVGNVGNYGVGTVNLSSGDAIYIGGQLQTQNLNSFGGNVYTNGARYGSTQNPAPSDYHFNQSNTITAPVSPAASVASQKSTLTDDLAYLSYGLSTLSSSKNISSLATLSTADYGSKTYVVFSIADGAAFFSQGGDIASMLANMPSTTAVIINVGGTTINQSVNYNNIAYNQDILWNFYQATTVNLTSFDGSVLAPKATVFNSSTISGSVIASVFNQGGEVHLGTFQGNMTDALKAITVADPAGAVPEPASWAMMMLGFGAIGTMIRKQKRAGVMLWV